MKLQLIALATLTLSVSAKADITFINTAQSVYQVRTIGNTAYLMATPALSLLGLLTTLALTTTLKTPTNPIPKGTDFACAYQGNITDKIQGC